MLIYWRVYVISGRIGDVDLIFRSSPHHITDPDPWRQLKWAELFDTGKLMG